MCRLHDHHRRGFLLSYITQTQIGRDYRERVDQDCGRVTDDGPRHWLTTRWRQGRRVVTNARRPHVGSPGRKSGTDVGGHPSFVQANMNPHSVFSSIYFIYSIDEIGTFKSRNIKIQLFISRYVMLPADKPPKYTIQYKSRSNPLTHNY